MNSPLPDEHPADLLRLLDAVVDQKHSFPGRTVAFQVFCGGLPKHVRIVLATPATNDSSEYAPDPHNVTEPAGFRSCWPQKRLIVLVSKGLLRSRCPGLPSPLTPIFNFLSIESKALIRTQLRFALTHGVP